MGRIKLTKEWCYIAGSDAGNMSMRQGNRSKWNQEDYTAASKEYTRVLDLLEKPVKPI